MIDKIYATQMSSVTCLTWHAAHSKDVHPVYLVQTGCQLGGVRNAIWNHLGATIPDRSHITEDHVHSAMFHADFSQMKMLFAIAQMGPS